MANSVNYQHFKTLLNAYEKAYLEKNKMLVNVLLQKFWIWIIMNFFANFGRVNTISISKIAVKSNKLCVKTSFWYIPEIIARIFNQQRVGCQRFCYVTVGGGILQTLRTVTREEGGPNFRQKQHYVTFQWSLTSFMK